MSEVQGPENKLHDPRWIMLRVSRINLGISLLGTLLAFPVLWLVNGLPVSIRLSLLVAFVLTMAADLWLILLKGRYSVAAFYLYELEQPSAPADAQTAMHKSRVNTPRLGIRLRFANAAKHPGREECDGIVLPRAFVAPWFTALRYQLPGDAAWRRWWPRVIPLWADSLDAAEFRKTRVALKWK